MHNLLVQNIIKSTEKNTSWEEADSTSASQESARILCNAKVHYLVQKSASVVRSLRSILILSFHPLIGIPSCLFSSVFSAENPWLYICSPNQYIVFPMKCPYQAMSVVST